MPALGIAQETGKLIAWRKREGDSVAKGEPIMEVETDKVTVEIEAPASGVVAGLSAREGDVIPVGKIIAWILSPGESLPSQARTLPSGKAGDRPAKVSAPPVSPAARQLADELGIDLSRVTSRSGRIMKADVELPMEKGLRPPATPARRGYPQSGCGAGARLLPASPKARRLAAERGLDLSVLRGSGPDGAVLATDVLAVPSGCPPCGRPSSAESGEARAPTKWVPGAIWKTMAERVTKSWTQIPHFYLTREVAAGNLVESRRKIGSSVETRTGVKLTYTDLLVKLVAAKLRAHPQINAGWGNGTIRWNRNIHIGIATAVPDGLVVPVIHHADQLSLGDIATRRQDLVERAQAGKLRPQDVAGGTFTITNLGMYGMDAFNAIINPPQAAILAVGRIADRVVAVAGQPHVRPMMILTLSCDHRVVDGARAARFLDDLANLVKEPWEVLQIQVQV